MNRHGERILIHPGVVPLPQDNFRRDVVRRPHQEAGAVMRFDCQSS